MPDEKMKFNQSELIQTINFCNFLDFLEKNELMDINVKCNVGVALNNCQTLLGYIVLNQVEKKPKEPK